MRRKASRESRGAHAKHGIGGQRACTVVGHIKLVGFVRVGAEVVGCGGDADDDGRQDTGERVRWGLSGVRGGGGAHAKLIAGKSCGDNGVDTGGRGTRCSRGAGERKRRVDGGNARCGAEARKIEGKGPRCGGRCSGRCRRGNKKQGREDEHVQCSCRRHDRDVCSLGVLFACASLPFHLYPAARGWEGMGVGGGGGCGCVWRGVAGEGGEKNGEAEQSRNELQPCSCCERLRVLRCRTPLQPEAITLLLELRVSSDCPRYGVMVCMRVCMHVCLDLCPAGIGSHD